MGEVVPTSYHTGSYYKEQAEKQWESLTDEFNSLPTAGAQLAFLFTKMMPALEKGVEGTVMYQGYIMNCMAENVIPAFNEIEDALQSNYMQGTSNTGNEGLDAFNAANELLQFIYTNPNLSGDTQFLSTLKSTIYSLFDCGTDIQFENAPAESTQQWLISMSTVSMQVTVNGKEETVEVPQMHLDKDVDAQWQPYNDPSDINAVVNALWGGDPTSYETNGEPYQNTQQYQTEFNGWITGCNTGQEAGSDISASAQNMTKYRFNQGKQINSGISSFLHDLYSVRNNEINNLKTS